MLDYQSAGGGSGGGDRTPILKFSAKDGSFIAVNRSQIDGQWQSQERELEAPIQVAMDMAEIEMGWMHFNPAPDFHMAKSGQPRPEKPSDDHKWGFRVRLCNKDIGLRELSSSSRNVYDRMVKLYQAYEAGKAQNPGKVPIVDITGTERVTQTLNDGQTQTWRVPQWTLSGWVDRPTTLDSAPETTAAVAPPASIPPSEAATGADLF
jgi:hypothetical protein